MLLNDLIDKASAIAGSDYKLAKLLGVSTGAVCDWRAGRRSCAPEDWALLAHVAGLDPEEALIRAVLAKHRDSKKGERLTTALGKGLHRIGAAAFFVTFASVVSLLMAISGGRSTQEANGLFPSR